MARFFIEFHILWLKEKKGVASKKLIGRIGDGVVRNRGLRSQKRLPSKGGEAWWLRRYPKGEGR